MMIDWQVKVGLTQKVSTGTFLLKTYLVAPEWIQVQFFKIIQINKPCNSTYDYVFSAEEHWKKCANSGLTIFQGFASNHSKELIQGEITLTIILIFYIVTICF